MFFVAEIYPKINLRINVIYMFKAEKFPKTKDFIDFKTSLPIEYNTKMQYKIKKCNVVSYNTMDADYKTHFGNNIQLVLYPNTLYWRRRKGINIKQILN